MSEKHALNLMDKLCVLAYGRSLTDALRLGICVSCGKPRLEIEYTDNAHKIEGERLQMCDGCISTVLDRLDEPENGDGQSG